MSLAIPGLPEGVVCTRVGMAKPDEYEIVQDFSHDTYVIKRGLRQGTTSQVIVVPVPDYEFVPNGDGSGFLAAKKLGAPVDISVTVKFRVTNSLDERRVHSVLDTFRHLPGFIDMK